MALAGSVGGTSARLQGGDFETGFIYAAAAQGVRSGVENFTGRDPTYKLAKGDAIAKEAGNRYAWMGCVDCPHVGENVLAQGSLAVNDSVPFSWGAIFKENGPLSILAKTVPGLNSGAIYHDMWGLSGVANKLTIPAGLGVNYYGLGVHSHIYQESIRRERND